ncbi:hypothetical protein ACNQFZ_01405 [Schinkia sp. CFF1]
MKKIVAIVIVLFAALIGWLYYINLTNIDEFRLNGYTMIPKDKVQVKDPMYVSFDMNYHGNGKPIIKAIRFIKTDGSFLEKEDENMAVTSYIDEKGATLANAKGPLSEAEAKQLNLLENYTPIENYQVNQKSVNVVVKVMIKNPNYTNNLSAIEIDYELLGSKETKQILFSGFVEE